VQVTKFNQIQIEIQIFYDIIIFNSIIIDAEFFKMYHNNYNNYQISPYIFSTVFSRRHSNTVSEFLPICVQRFFQIQI